MKIQHGRTFASLVGIACIAGGAFAQGLISTSGVVVADIGDTVPDYAGAPMAGFTFGGSGNFDGATIDDNGNILFRARFIDVGGSTLPFNDRAYFKGSSRATLQMVIRGGDQAPTMTPGYLLRTTTGSSVSITSNCRIAPNGNVFWGSNIFDSGGVGGITAADDECWFGGPVGAQTMLLRQGSAAAGTGATFAQAFSGISQQTQSMDRNGNLCFFATLTGGDVVGTTNQQGIWWGPPASLTLVQRKGEAANGIPGTFVSTTSTSALGFTVSCNTAGTVFYEIALDNVLGGTPAATTADRAMMLWSAGAGHQVIGREGDVAPSTAGATYNMIAGSANENWFPGYGANILKQSGVVIFTSTLKGGDVVGTDNDSAVFRGTPGSIVMVARENDAAPGTDGVFNTFNNTYTLHNNNGKACLQASLRGGTVTTANDSGVWVGTPGNLQLILREGMTMPGGGTLGSVSGITTYFNDRDQILIGSVTLIGGTSPGSSYWLHNPGQGLVPVCLATDQVEVLPGVFKTCTGIIGGNTFGNTDGAALAFTHDGKIGTRVGFTDGTAAMIVITTPDPIAGTAFCFGDGIDLSHTTPCPCGNNGAPGNGCENSVNASGANLTASGSTFTDDVVLEASLMPVTSSCIYLQGDAIEDVSFGDGVRCAGGSLIRLRTRNNVAGASTFPDSTDTITLSARGGVVPGSGDTRYYQTYYRNAAALFCPPETFNVSNGMFVTW